MKYFRKTDRKALAGTLLVHAVLVALLFWLTLSAPQQDMLPEEGIPVLLGNAEASSADDGPGFPHGMETPAPDAAEEAAEIPQPVPQETPRQPDESTGASAQKSRHSQPLVTQEDPSVALAEKKAAAEAEAKRRAAEEARRREREEEAARKAEAERRAAQAASDRVKNRFGSGAEGGGKGDAAAKGTQGMPNGNSKSGQPIASLPGRSPHALPLPSYPGNEEGDVVVRIIVNAAGQVIWAGIQTSGTNTSNAALRDAALKAARQATFNAVDGAADVTGNITYRFRLQ